MECWPPKMKILGKDCTQLDYLLITNTITTNSEIPLSIDLIRPVIIAFLKMFLLHVVQEVQSYLDYRP